jgi:hypothetical protein
MESRRGSIEIIEGTRKNLTVGARSTRSTLILDTAWKPIVRRSLTSQTSTVAMIPPVTWGRSAPGSVRFVPVGRKVRSPDGSGDGAGADDDYTIPK